MVRMRNIAQVLEAIKQIEPETSITMHAIRCVAKSREIKTVCLNKKILLDLDRLLKFFHMEGK